MWHDEGNMMDGANEKQPGGGFVSDDFASQNGAAGGGSKGKGYVKFQSIMPVAISQLVECNEEHLKIYGQEADFVSIVGVIKSVETSTTKIIYVIEDQSGSIETSYYAGTNNEFRIEDMVILSEGSYARIVGTFRYSNGNKYIVMFNSFQLTDLNEITTHMLEVALMPIRLKKLQEQESLMPEVGGGNMLSNSMIGGEFGGDVKPPLGGSGGLAGLTANQNKIFMIIKQYSDDIGISKDKIQEVSGMSRKDLETILDFLSGEGHIFSTIDDDHVKVTEFD